MVLHVNVAHTNFNSFLIFLYYICIPVDKSAYGLIERARVRESDIELQCIKKALDKTLYLDVGAGTLQIKNKY